MRGVVAARNWKEVEGGWELNTVVGHKEGMCDE